MTKWFDVPDYIGLYKINKNGEIKSLYYNKVLKFLYDKKGYVRAHLYKNNKAKSYQVHRLVATTFIPNPKNKPQVNHINGIKNDNRVKNLEWATAKENIIHGRENNLYTEPWNKGLGKIEFYCCWCNKKTLRKQSEFKRYSNNYCSHDCYVCYVRENIKGKSKALIALVKEDRKCKQ